MNRRNFLKLTGTCTGGMLLLPDFLHSYALQDNPGNDGNSCIVFIQLNGGNDGLNTFIPYQDDLYYKYRPAISISKNDVITSSGGMAFHPSLKGLAEIQQKGDLTVLQNVGYPEPNHSHFRSQEIWQTASSSNDYFNNGWLGRFLDHHHKHYVPTAGINIDTTDNLALRGIEQNSISFTRKMTTKLKTNTTLSSNPQLDFVRKIANAAPEGYSLINKAIDKTTETENLYPKNIVGKNLQLIARLIKGGLNSDVYYTSHNGFDTHNNQLSVQKVRLQEVDEAILAFYKDIKAAKKLEEVTLVIFSEFGRRVADNGRGTDHGTAAPMFIIGGKNKGKIIGKNPDLVNLIDGDLKHEIDFRSVYASLLKNKFAFNPADIGIKNTALTGIF